MIDLSDNAIDPLWHVLAVSFKGNAEQVREFNRAEPIATVRAALIVAGVKICGLTTRQLGKHFHRDHSTITHHVRSHKDRLVYDQLYLEAYTTIEEELTYE